MTDTVPQASPSDSLNGTLISEPNPFEVSFDDKQDPKSSNKPPSVSRLPSLSFLTEDYQNNGLTPSIMHPSGASADADAATAAPGKENMSSNNLFEVMGNKSMPLDQQQGHPHENYGPSNPYMTPNYGNNNNNNQKKNNNPLYLLSQASTTTQDSNNNDLVAAAALNSLSSENGNPKKKSPGKSISGKVSSPNDSDSADELKRKNFLERNRQAALKCRQRKKAWLANLQSKVDLLSTENESLNVTVASLREENSTLRNVLSAHANCPISVNGHQPGGPHAVSHSAPHGQPMMHPPPHAYATTHQRY